MVLLHRAVTLYVKIKWNYNHSVPAVKLLDAPCELLQWTIFVRFSLKLLADFRHVCVFGHLYFVV